MEIGLASALAFTRTEAHGMKGKTKEHWMQLCEQAACEQDPDRLIELVQEIDRMLSEKETRLKREHGTDRLHRSDAESTTRL